MTSIDTAADALDFAMFDLPALAPETAAERRAARERKADAARLAYRTAEREGTGDPREAAARAAADAR